MAAAVIGRRSCRQRDTSTTGTQRLEVSGRLEVGGEGNTGGEGKTGGEVKTGGG